MNTTENNIHRLDAKPLARLFSKFTALVILAITLSSASSHAQEHSDPGWVTTWSASPGTLPNSEDQPEGIADQTLRLIAHTSVGGSSVRIRLSNVHGNKPIIIGAASVAIQSEGSTIQAGSSASLSFTGESTIAIARGAVVFSDPVSYPVPELTNLSVSLYLPEDSGFLTAHTLANQTNYISENGDYSSATSLPVATETPAWNLLTAIDVINPESVTAIATVGDSITDGWGSTIGANERWPNHLARRFFNQTDGKKFAIVNGGISGNRVTTEANSLFGQNLQARFERDVLALSKVSHAVLLEGINDIGMSSSTNPISAGEIIAGYRQVIARAHARGIKVMGATLTPYEGAAYFTEEGETVRQQLNAFIRNSGEFDGLIDFDKAVRDSANPQRIIPAFTEDKLHPNDAGYKAMADAVDMSLFD